ASNAVAGQRGGGHGGGGIAGGRSGSPGRGGRGGSIGGPAGRGQPSSGPMASPLFPSRLATLSVLPSRRISPFVGPLFGAGTWSWFNSLWWPGSTIADEADGLVPSPLPYA